MLHRHLELSRILKKVSNTKAAMELMLHPSEKGLKKAAKKLFPVCSTANQLSDSSSEEEQMLAIALENAQKVQDQRNSVSQAEFLRQSEDALIPSPELPNMLEEDTMRHLVKSFRSNDAGEAIYDSS